MQKVSKFLKVISIILIIFGAFGLLSSALLLALKDTFNEMYASMGIDLSLSAFDIITSFIGSIIYLAAGILGVMHKSKKTVLIAGIILCLYYLFSMVQTFLLIGFSFLAVIQLIIPILYIWGWYRSE